MPAKVIWGKDYILVDHNHLKKCYATLDVLPAHVYMYILLTGSHKKDNRGIARLSIQQIAHDTGMKKEIVLGCLRTLQKKGLITVDKSLRMSKNIFQPSNEIEITPLIMGTEQPPDAMGDK